MNASTKVKSAKGSMAVYVSIVLLSMILVLTAIFLISNSVRKNQINTVIKVKETYEADNDKAGKIYEGLTRKEYVKDGLILHYDANNNTGVGHSIETTTWTDLSGNNRNCNLFNLDNNSNSGWTDNSLKLDGINDYGIIQNLDLTGYGELTICSTYKVLSVENRASARPALLCSNNAGGGRIYFGYDGNNSYLINYTYPDTWFPTENKEMTVNQTASVAATYMGTNATQKNRIYKNGNLLKEMQAVMTNGWVNYQMTLGQAFGGGYASGTNPAHPYANVEIYDILIYNRTLSKEEIKQNYEVSQQNYKF